MTSLYQAGNVKSSTAVAPTLIDNVYDQLSSTESEEEEDDKEPVLVTSIVQKGSSSSSIEETHDALQTSVSLDRVQKLVEESQSLSTSSSDDEDEV